jgi:hypothetical protein
MAAGVALHSDLGLKCHKMADTYVTLTIGGHYKMETTQLFEGISMVGYQ